MTVRTIHFEHPHEPVTAVLWQETVRAIVHRDGADGIAAHYHFATPDDAARAFTELRDAPCPAFLRPTEHVAFWMQRAIAWEAEGHHPAEMEAV